MEEEIVGCDPRDCTESSCSCSFEPPSSIDELKMEICKSYVFELKAFSSDDVYGEPTLASLSANIAGTLTYFSVKFERENYISRATWPYLGEACRYNLIYGDNIIATDIEYKKEGYVINTNDVINCQYTYVSVAAVPNNCPAIESNRFYYMPGGVLLFIDPCSSVII